MEISKLFDEKLFFIDFEAKNKKEFLKSISEKIEKEGFSNDKKELFKAFKKREKEFSTGIGYGLAIPHARVASITKPVIAFAQMKDEVNWGKTLDNKNVKNIFTICIPLNDQAGSDHMETIAQLSRKFMDEKFRKSILEIKNFKDLTKLFK